MIGFVNKGAGLRGAGVIVASLLLVACSQPLFKGRPQQPEALPQPVAPEAKPAQPEPLAEPAAQKQAPLSARLLYEVLLGEIAGQRGVMDVSAASYLEAALHKSSVQLPVYAASRGYFHCPYDGKGRTYDIRAIYPSVRETAASKPGK